MVITTTAGKVLKPVTIRGWIRWGLCHLGWHDPYIRNSDIRPGWKVRIEFCKWCGKKMPL